MSPIAASAGATDGKSSGVMSLFQGHAAAATLAGTLEIAVFHPFDTIAKRLMSNKTPVRGENFGATMSNLNQVIFKKHANSSIVEKIKYVYPGSMYAVSYKVLQRVYKFAGQPIVKRAIDDNCGSQMKSTFGKKGSKLMTESVAGCLIGIGEVVLLPLDRLKVLSQTNQEALKGRSALSILWSEGRGMYAGTLVTVARNAPGSFSLFGGAAFTKDFLFGLDDYSKATFFQNSVASLVGSIASISITNPMDVVKTRIQNKNLGEKHHGLKILGEIVREEGFGGFCKGLTPKIVASAPKLVFAYTLTEYFAKLLKGSSQKKAVGAAH